jgi:hypothetical protein
MVYSICKEKKRAFAKLVHKSQKILGPQSSNPQSVTFMEGPQSNKLFKSANLRICDLRTLFADRPPLGVAKKLRLG